MEFRAQAAILILILWTLPAMAQEFRYPARHDRLHGGGDGTLVIDPEGIGFSETSHQWRWGWRDIQRLTLSPRRLTVLTYRDDPWRLGADRVYRFDLPESASLADAYGMLRGRLDQRFVAVLPDAPLSPVWRMPAKHLLRFGGSQGVLALGPDTVVYETGRPGEARTWRYRDIESVSSSGPFQLTIISYEKAFNFQLKEPMRESRYNDLWRRVNQEKLKP